MTTYVLPALGIAFVLGVVAGGSSDGTTSDEPSEAISLMPSPNATAAKPGSSDPVSQAWM